MIQIKLSDKMAPSFFPVHQDVKQHGHTHYVLAGGGIAQVGAPLELYERPMTEFVAQFIGSPSMNLLPGKIVGTGAETQVKLENGGSVRAAIATTAALTSLVGFSTAPAWAPLAVGAAAAYGAHKLWNWLTD